MNIIHADSVGQYPEVLAKCPLGPWGPIAPPGLALMISPPPPLDAGQLRRAADQLRAELDRRA